MMEKQNYKYQYSLGGYKAVKSAKIDIESITVVAGVNGCGKSTLSRWLYYTTDIINRYNTLVYQEYLSGAWQLYMKYDNVKNELNVANSDPEAFAVFKLPDMITQMAIRQSTLENVEKIQEWLEVKLESLCHSLEEYIAGNGSLVEVDRLLIGLGVGQGSKTAGDDRVEKVMEAQKKIIDGLTARYKESIGRRSMKNFLSLIKANYQERDMPPRIALLENGVEIIGPKVNVMRTLQGLQRVIYVDSPMAVSVDAQSPSWWKVLRDNMNHDNLAFEPSKEAKNLMKIISELMRGEVRMKKSGIKGSAKELTFVSRDDEEIRLKDLATGFKTLTYIYRLLDNGVISDNTLLIIDEPEAHLHPKWIAEFARILVLLNKKMGVKVFVATQSPQFVEALRAMANKEKTLDSTRFYLAVPSDDDDSRFTYRDLGQEAVDIFRSFNQIYDKIEEYGDEDYD